MDSIGDRIKESMENKGITPYKLFKGTKISQSTIGRILKNENEPNRSTIESISKFLGVNPDWILTGKGKKETDYFDTEVPEIKKSLPIKENDDTLNVFDRWAKIVQDLMEENKILRQRLDDRNNENRKK